MRATCRSCHSEFKYRPTQQRGHFCSSSCWATWQKEVVTRQKFEAGTLPTRSIARRYVIERDGEKCSVCGVADWCSKPLTLDLDHTDGDASNNGPSNLRLICPNCHSQTPTYGGKNKGRGRKSLGIPEY